MIQLLPVGGTSAPVLARLRAGLSREFEVPCEMLGSRLDPSFALHPERKQVHATEVLARLQRLVRPETWRLLAVTDADLYVPILTFVFGEAQLEGPCAVVSTHRLRQEFYGLPPDPDLLDERLLKEAVHELAHTMGLSHCDDYRCALAASHAVERVDLKGISLCTDCRGRCPRPPKAGS